MIHNENDDGKNKLMRMEKTVDRYYSEVVHETRELLRGSSEPSRKAVASVRHEVYDVSIRVAAKLEERRRLAEEEEPAEDSVYTTLPSIASVEKSSRQSRASGANMARLVAKGLEKTRKEKSASLNHHTTTIKTTSNKRIVSTQRRRDTTAEVYSEDQSILLGKKEKRDPARRIMYPEEMEACGMLTAEHFRLKYRDEAAREKLWINFTSQMIALEKKALETGIIIDPPKNVARHPIIDAISKLAHDECAAMVFKSRKNMLACVKSIWQDTIQDLVTKSTTVKQEDFDSSFRIKTSIDQHPLHIAKKNKKIKTAKENSFTAPPAGLIQCILDGIYTQISSSTQESIDVRVWVHRRKVHTGAEWKVWRWRFTVYQLASGTCRTVTLNQTAALSTAESLGLIIAQGTVEEDDASWTTSERDNALLVEGLTSEQIVPSLYKEVATKLLPLLWLERQGVPSLEALDDAGRRVFTTADLDFDGVVDLRDLGAIIHHDESIKNQLNLPPIFGNGYNALCRFFIGLPGVLPRRSRDSDNFVKTTQFKPRRPWSASVLPDKETQKERHGIRIRPWLQWLRMRFSKAGFTQDNARLVLGPGRILPALDESDCEYGYLGMENRDDGSDWEAKQDPRDGAPLSMRICEFSQYRENLLSAPGTAVIGLPPKIHFHSDSLRTKVVGMFRRNVAGSTDSMVLNTCIALDDPKGAPWIQADDNSLLIAHKCSHDEPIIASSSGIIPRCAPGKRAVLCTHATSLVNIMPKTMSIVLDLDSTSSIMTERNRNTRTLCPRPEWFHTKPHRIALEAKKNNAPYLESHAFGIRTVLSSSTKVSAQFSYCSVQRCIEQLCRRREAADYLDAAKSKEQGRGLPSAVLYNSSLRAFDESTYTQYKLRHFSIQDFKARHAAVGIRKKRELQRSSVLSHLQDLVNGIEYAELVRARTRQQLREKALRLVNRRGQDALGLGDRPEAWQCRLDRSVIYEEQGSWQRRVDQHTYQTFYYNSNEQALAPRFTWDAPESFEGNNTAEDEVPLLVGDRSSIGVSTINTNCEEVEDEGAIDYETVDNVVSRLVNDEVFVAALVDRLGGSYVPADISAPVSSTEEEEEEEEEPREDDQPEDEAIGDDPDWRQSIESRLLPQDHADMQRARAARRRQTQHDDAAVRHDCGPAPAYGENDWRKEIWHVRGAYWRQLPRAQPAAQFIARSRDRCTLAGDDPSWRENAQISLPLRQVGMYRPSCDERSWEATSIEVNPPPLVKLSAIFVKDAQDEMDRVLALSKRRADREARFARKLPLTELVGRGPRLTTTSEELIVKEEREQAILDRQLIEPPRVVLERALQAARSNNLYELETCIDAHGIDVNARDGLGNTLLILAAQQNDKRLIKFLLRRGADPDYQNFAGNTALHFCFGYSYKELGEYLKSKGADDTFINADGLSPYEFNLKTADEI